MNSSGLSGLAGVCLLLVVVLSTGPAVSGVLAQESGRSEVELDGRTIFLVGPIGDTDASTRAARVEQRLEILVENPDAITPASIEVSPGSASDRVVVVAGVPVVTVTQLDAEDNLTTVDVLAETWAQAIETRLQSAVASRSSVGERFLTEVRVSVETAFIDLRESAIEVVPRIIAAALVLLGFWALASGIRWLMRLLLRLVIDDLTVQSLLKQLVFYLIWIMGLLVAINALGLDTETVIAALGLTGLALGFALKDILSNFTSGILILTMRPFHLGDQIAVGETEGTVEAIRLRATEIRTYDGRLTLVPNAEVFTSRVVNNTASPVRRGSVEFFLDYEADVSKALEVVEAGMRQAPGVLLQPEPSARLRRLGENDLVLEALFWTDSRRSDFLATSSAVADAMVTALREAGVSLPDPAIRKLVATSEDSPYSGSPSPGVTPRP